MARIRLVVHLGLHKTGTTSIQQYLQDHPYQLHSAGILYPGVGRHALATTQHAVLTSAFQDTEPLAGEFALARPVNRDVLVAALREEIEISGCDTAVVSSEEFSRLGPDAVKSFAEAFGDFALVPVVFLRNFVDLVDAIYASCILYSDLVDDPGTYLMPTDLLPAFRAWAAAADDGLLRVIDYDASPTGDSVRDFLTVAGLLTGVVPDQRSAGPLNLTAPPYQVAVAREFKRAGIDLGYVRGLSWQLAGLRPAEPQTNLPAPLRAELRQLYSRLYAELRQASWVEWHGSADTPPEAGDEPQHVEGLVAGVLALGRALAQRAEPVRG